MAHGTRRLTVGCILALATAADARANAGAPEVEGCAIFPANNVWNTPIDHLPVHSHSSDWVASIGVDNPLTARFGSAPENGVPINIVSGSQPVRPVIMLAHAGESDHIEYPIPDGALVEGGGGTTGDRRLLMLDRDSCMLYELYHAELRSNGFWYADAGAVFDLTSNALRRDGWRSADRAGLAVLPGLVRYDEAASGEINHALRFTASRTQRGRVWPARDGAGSIIDPRVPPMGARFRLKANFDVAGYAPEVQVILRALQKYGMILADEGADWGLGGAPDPRWDEAALAALGGALGASFEAVDASLLTLDPDSGAAAQPCPGDLDRDGDVDPDDLATLLGAWGDDSHSKDLNGDGAVDEDDLTTLMSGWGACPSSAPAQQAVAKSDKRGGARRGGLAAPDTAQSKASKRLQRRFKTLRRWADRPRRRTSGR